MGREDRPDRRALEDYGIVFVSGEIDQTGAQSVCERIIEINTSDQADTIQLIIHSPGGVCTAGFAIIDVMEWSRVPVYTTGLGIVGSAALWILMAGHKGHRVLTPRTSILSHRFSGLSWGNHSELIAKRKEEDLMHRRLLDHYLEHTALETEAEITGRLLRDVDTWLTPREALNMGIADIIQGDRGAGQNGE